MPKRNSKPKPPTGRQREIGERFKAGESVREICLSMTHIASCRCDDIERAIRACLVWGRRDV